MPLGNIYSSLVTFRRWLLDMAFGLCVSNYYYKEVLRRVWQHGFGQMVRRQIKVITEEHTKKPRYKGPAVLRASGVLSF